MSDNELGKRQKNSVDIITIFIWIIGGMVTFASLNLLSQLERDMKLLVLLNVVTLLFIMMLSFNQCLIMRKTK